MVLACPELVEARRCVASDVVSASDTLARPVKRHLALVACADTCVAEVRLCRRRRSCGSPTSEDVCGPAVPVAVAAPQSGSARQVLRLPLSGARRVRRRVVVDCRRAEPGECVAPSLPDDGVYDLRFVDRAPSSELAHLRHAASGAFELSLYPDALSELTLSGVRDPDGTLSLQGGGIVGGDVLVEETARLTIETHPTGTRLAGTLGSGSQIELERPNGAGPSSPETLALVLELSGGGDAVELRLGLPLAQMENGVATTSPADLLAGDAVFARVRAGRCFISPTRRFWCRMPWEEGGESYYAFLAGVLGDPGPFNRNQIYVGLPPKIVWSGSWRSAS
jgi:hypothetical protein